MAEYDISFKIAAHSSGREMCWLRNLRPEAWEPISDTLQTTERLADRAFRAEENGRRFVVYFEAFTEWRDDDRWGLLAKSGLLSQRERCPTRTFLFYLTPKGYQEQHGTFRLAVEDEVTQQLWFREVCLWREQPQEWWERIPGLMALLPLCDHGRGEEEVVTYAAHQITNQVADTIVRADLLASLGFFGLLASPHLDAFGLIGREMMSHSPFYQAILAEGELNGQRAAILEALSVRFGEDAAAEFREVMNTITDSARLSELLRTAIKCRGISGFRRAVQPRDS